MNSQRAFWISGAATLAVMLLLGLAVNSRQDSTTASPTTTQYTAQVEPWPAEPAGYSYREKRDRDEYHEDHEEREEKHERKHRRKHHEDERHEREHR